MAGSELMTDIILASATSFALSGVFLGRKDKKNLMVVIKAQLMRAFYPCFFVYTVARAMLFDFLPIPEVNLPVQRIALSANFQVSPVCEFIIVIR